MAPLLGLRRHGRRLRLAGDVGTEDQPVLQRRGAVPRPLLQLSPVAVVGAQDSATVVSNRVNTNGPPWNFRKESIAQALLRECTTAASQGAIVPENLVVGSNADAVAAFLSEVLRFESRKGHVDKHRPQGMRSHPASPRPVYPRHVSVQHMMGLKRIREDSDGVRAALRAARATLPLGA